MRNTLHDLKLLLNIQVISEMQQANINHSKSNKNVKY